jgi:uncharacterized protein (DUF697 family)
MPKLPSISSLFQKAPHQAQGAWRVWSLFKALNVQDIAEAAERPFHLALVGSEDQTDLLMARLALESAAPRDLGPAGPADIHAFVGRAATAADVPPGSLTLDAETLTASETELAGTLAAIVQAHPDLRLSLARHVPAFRPAVVTQLINDASKENAKIALLSALPGVIPLTDFLLPATALGDMLLLTKNQGLLLLSIAAAYGREVDLRARTRELLPVVGSAFGWRTAARQLIGLVPGGIGLVIKGAVAYAGTYTVGRAAAVYYSTGHTLSGPRLHQLYKDALREAFHRVSLLRKRPLTKAAQQGYTGAQFGESNNSEKTTPMQGDEVIG